MKYVVLLVGLLIGVSIYFDVNSPESRAKSEALKLRREECVKICAPHPLNWRYELGPCDCDMTKEYR